MFLALVLFSMVFTFEWIGTSVLAEKAIVNTERLDQLKQQSQALTGKILNLKSYKNWRDISARQDYTKQQESLQKAIEKEEATVIKQQEKATEKAFHFRFISVVLAVVSAIATLLSQQDLSVYNQVKVDKSLIDLPAQERINRASEYIKETGEVDQRRIMPMFHLNPIQVGKAKKLAGVATKKSTSNSQGVIGFN
jgi:vacuolar-type H+-ATPase subunit I/STV1